MKKESMGLLAGAAVLGLAAWLYLHYSGQVNSSTAIENATLPQQNNQPFMMTAWGPEPLGPVLIGGDLIKMKNTYNAYVQQGGLTVQGGNTLFEMQQPKLLSLFGCSNCGCGNNG